MKTLLTAGFAGLLFAVGLTLGGMTDPAKVAGFLDFAGDWDPSLAFVMGGAVFSHATLRLIILRFWAKPVLAANFPTFVKTRVDAKLVAGAALFGVGWGLSGYCPGPAIAAVGTGSATILLFLGSMAAGMFLFSRWELSREKRPALTEDAAV